jgi:hypothetical protein
MMLVPHFIWSFSIRYRRPMLPLVPRVPRMSRFEGREVVSRKGSGSADGWDRKWVPWSVARNSLSGSMARALLAAAVVASAIMMMASEREFLRMS